MSDNKEHYMIWEYWKKKDVLYYMERKEEMVDKKSSKKLIYFIKTFGCQMNVNDSEYLAGQLEEMGYESSTDLYKADLIILNTCCVRAKVEQKIYSLAGIVSQIKKEKPEIIFGICGCLAEKEKDNIQKKIPSIDLIFGPSQITSFKELLEVYRDNQRREVVVFCDNRKSLQLANKPIKYNHHIRAYVQIMKGCNNFCSYCVVPYTRGPEASRSTDEVIKEIETLARKNYKEIMLLGQNVNSYGHDLSTGDNFLTLLSRINSIDGIERIRFTTSHPKDFNLELIKVIKKGKKICEHIHLPLQSGSNRILSKMNRKYHMDQYYKIIDSLREHIPGVSISTDVMVGFPGETENDFQQTIEAFQKIQFDSAYTFIYSHREPALASFLGEDIPLLVAKRRLWTLNQIQNNISNQINQGMVGKIEEILVENSSKKGIKNQYWGKTRTNKIVVFPGSDENELLGRLVRVKINQADSYTLYGELVNVIS